MIKSSIIPPLSFNKNEYLDWFSLSEPKSAGIIFSNELHIVSYQTYVFNERGILKKNSDNIFDTSNRSNIYVDIYLS